MMNYLFNHMTLTLVLTGILGLCIGSFLNVIIYRYPLMLQLSWRKECQLLLQQPTAEPNNTFNLIWPPSQCTHCQQRLALWHLIPIISFLTLGGKCAYCKKNLSPIYPLIELITAILSIFVVYQYGISLSSLFLLLFTWGLIALSVIDYQHLLLPDAIIYCLLWLGLIANLNHLFTSPEQAIWGAIVGYLSFYLIGKIYYYLRHREGLGHGDFKMFATIGAWVGFSKLLIVIIIAAPIGLVIGFIALLLNNFEQTPLPFGPYLAISSWITLMYGKIISQILFPGGF